MLRVPPLTVLNLLRPSPLRFQPQEIQNLPAHYPYHDDVFPQSSPSLAALNLLNLFSLRFQPRRTQNLPAHYPYHDYAFPILTNAKNILSSQHLTLESHVGFDDALVGNSAYRALMLNTQLMMFQTACNAQHHMLTGPEHRRDETLCASNAKSLSLLRV